VSVKHGVYARPDRCGLRQKDVGNQEVLGIAT